MVAGWQLTIELQLAIEQLHAWTAKIYDAVVGHADSIDMGSREQAVMRGKLAAYEAQQVRAQEGAETQITAVFARMDASVSQLREEATTTAKALADRAERVEVALQALTHAQSQAATYTEPTTSQGAADQMWGYSPPRSRCSGRRWKASPTVSPKQAKKSACSRAPERASPMVLVRSRVVWQQQSPRSP